MHTRKRGGALLAALAFALLLAAPRAAAAQDEGGEPARPQQPAARGEVNYEAQIQVLVTSEGAEGAARVPAALEGVVRQLKSAFPPAEYRVGATFFNRVNDGGSFEFRSMGPPPYPGSMQTAAGVTSYQIGVSLMGIPEGTAGGRLVRVHSFRFTLRVPVQATSAGGQSAPNIQYEDMGLNTQMGVRDGEPTLVGTLNTSRPGQLFVVVLTVKRVGK